MLKLTRSFNASHAVITAAVVAGIITIFSAPGSFPSATATVAAPVQTAAKSCAGEWPYLNCSGEQNVRVIKFN